MLRKINIFLARALSRVAWDLVYKHRHGIGSIPILCYHRVLPELIEDVNNPLYTLLPEQFDTQMAFLSNEGFVSLSLKDFVDIARKKMSPPEKSVVVTFDDGYMDNYAIAWPIAQKYQIQLNLFICTNYISVNKSLIMTDDGYFWLNAETVGQGLPSSWLANLKKYPYLWRPLAWQELGQMLQSGVQIGLHGHNHRKLGRLKEEEAIADIQTGVKIFAEKMGAQPEFFALPYGSYDSYTEKLLQILRSYQLNFIFGTHLGRAQVPTEAFFFPRICICQHDTLATFQRKLMGAYDWLEPIHYLMYRLKL
jgi:peptidoglycan/xylan/chitin deacetylase (PgdA/CDA1 family)